MSLLSYVGALDREECGRSRRLVYMCNIIKKFNQVQWLLPTASQEKSYDEALANVVGVLSGNNNNAPSSLAGRSKVKNRKICLEEMLNHLLHMQRNRLYDPPSDHEIGYYLLIKEYIRSIIAFYESRYDIERDAELGCFSPFSYLHHTTQLVDLNKYSDGLLSFVLKMDIKNVSKVRPLMDIKHKSEPPTIIYGSKERSNAFYAHKFQLALSELRSSKFQFSPPHAEEKRSYLQALDLMTPPPSSSSCELDVDTEELRHIFMERIESEVNKVERHCKKIKGLILEKLSLDKQWGTLLQMLEADGSEELDDVSREMAENCEISTEELPCYIPYLDQCQQILVNLSFSVSGLSTDNDNLLRFMSDDHPNTRVKLGWEAFHALTFLKQGACVVDPMEVRHDSKRLYINRRRIKTRSMRAGIRNWPNRIGVSEIRQKVTLSQKSRMLHKRPTSLQLVRSWLTLIRVGQVRSESANCLNHDYKWTGKSLAVKKEKNENVEVLKLIIESLKSIGDSDVRPDEEELILMHKIWNNVASAVHFSISAMLYEQKRYVIERGGFSDVGIFATKTSKPLDGVDVRRSVYKIENLAHELAISTEIIGAYKQGLVEKLQKSVSYS